MNSLFSVKVQAKISGFDNYHRYSPRLHRFKPFINWLQKPVNNIPNETLKLFFEL